MAFDGAGVLAGRAAVAVLTAAALTLAVPETAVSLPSGSVPSGSLPPGDTGSAVQADPTISRLARAEARLRELTAQLELKREDANKARVDLWFAQRAAGRARWAARGAEAEAEAARHQLTAQQHRLDQLVASTYRHGREIHLALMFAGPHGPQDVLERAEMLEVYGEAELDVLADLTRARVREANKKSRAAQAVRDAEARLRDADRSRHLAEKAEEAARSAEAEQAAQNARWHTQQAQAQLAEAQHSVEALAEQQAADREDDGTVPQVEAVVGRALSQVGVSYAWGGGDASGPSRGIRDGGAADSHGDYRKVGFDCSGLMLYAFAGVGVELDHYSGYQYESGRKVPLSSMRRGDLLFWRVGESTHHVALYLGDGRMVEAPYSGGEVRVTSVRYSGIAPYAVRLL